LGGIDGERRGGFALAAEIALADARAAGDPFVAGFDIVPHVVVADSGLGQRAPGGDEFQSVHGKTSFLIKRKDDWDSVQNPARNLRFLDFPL